MSFSIATLSIPLLVKESDDEASMSEAPKLYANKPRKAQLKQSQDHQGKSFVSPAAASYQMGSQAAASPPPPPLQQFSRRYKFLWPAILTVNIAVIGYLFMRTKKKDIPINEEQIAKGVTLTQTTSSKDSPVNEELIAKDAALATTTSTSAPVREEAFPLVITPVSREPVPEDQQRELFKWILEEKRKVKAKDAAEKKRIDEEKAMLKQFIRARSIPSI